MLSEQQIKHFHTLGFLVFRQVFSQDELNTIHEEFEAAMASAYRHAPFDGTHRHWLPMMRPETPFFSKFAGRFTILRSSRATVRRRCLFRCFRCEPLCGQYRLAP